MRKIILHELYKYKDDYQSHDIGHLIQKVIGDGDEKIVSSTLNEIANQGLALIESRHYAHNVVNHSHIGYEYSGQLLVLKDFSLKGRILQNGIKEVENDLLIESTNATNESLRVANKSIVDLICNTRLAKGRYW